MKVKETLFNAILKLTRKTTHRRNIYVQNNLQNPRKKIGLNKTRKSNQLRELIGP